MAIVATQKKWCQANPSFASERVGLQFVREARG
jgi:hypothetical protein